MGERDFSTADHIRAFKEKSRDGKKYQDDVNVMKLRGIVIDQGAFEKLLFLSAKHTGSCLSARGTMVTGTVLAAT